MGSVHRYSARVLTGSRRNFLGLSAGLAVAASMPKLAFAATAPLQGDGVSKFAPNGQVLPFPGNTIVCHLPQQGTNSAVFEELLDFYRMAPWTSFAPKLALLPPSSYHMTIIGGATDSGRTEGKWPIGIPLDAPIEECNRIVGERLRRAELPEMCPIRMRIDQADSGYDGNTLRIPVEPIDDAEFERLEGLRSAIARAIGIPAPVPGTYQFHITLGYLIRPFEAAEEQEALEVLADWKQRVVRASPSISLGIPEYCTFEDMFAFRRQFFLGLPQ